MSWYLQNEKITRALVIFEMKRVYELVLQSEEVKGVSYLKPGKALLFSRSKECMCSRRLGMHVEKVLSQ